MGDSRRISFGDNVLVRTTPETIQRGVAGLSGQVYGVTTPSVTGVDVIGRVQDDHALNVLLTEKNEAIWFAADLLECVDHAAGTEIRLKGVPKKWTRDVHGEWVEESVASDAAKK